MAEVPGARTVGVLPPNETILKPGQFQTLARTLKCMADVAGPYIMIENGRISTSDLTCIADADLSKLRINIIPMNIYADKNNLRNLGQLNGGRDVRIYYDGTAGKYFANNGHREMVIGVKADDAVAPPKLTLTNSESTPVSGFKVPPLRQFIGKTEKVCLRLYDGQLEQVVREDGSVLTLKPEGAFAFEGTAPDLTLRVGKPFKLKMGDEMKIEVGKIDEDYYVETTTKVSFNVYVRVVEKADVELAEIH